MENKFSDQLLLNVDEIAGKTCEDIKPMIVEYILIQEKIKQLKDTVPVSGDTSVSTQLKSLYMDARQVINSIIQHIESQKI